MKKIIALFLIVFLFANNLSVLAQRKTASSLPPPPKIVDLGSSNPLDNFSEKGLPEPYIIGENPSDELAAKMAKEILKYNDMSLPKLMATLQKAGFYIIDPNQKILYKPVVLYDMQMAFYDFEVIGMLRASGMGVGTTIKKFAELIAVKNKGLNPDNIGKSILEDLRRAKNSENPQVRFAAALIFEIGKQLPTPVDLAKTTPETSTINVIQSSLIERILLGDLMDSYEKISAGMYQKNNLFRLNQTGFINVGFLNKLNTPCEALEDLTNLRKTDSKAYYYAAKTSFFSETVGGDNLQQAFLQNMASGVLNHYAAQLWVKMLIALLKVKIEITGAEPSPLERTKSDKMPGDSRQLTAKFTMDLLDKEKAAQVGCLAKLAEARTGEKYDLPKPTSLEGQDVEWVLNSNSQSFMFDATQTNNFSPVTDSNGESKAKLIGKKQKEDLTIRKVTEKPLTLDIEVKILLKRADLEKSKIRSFIDKEIGGIDNVVEAYRQIPELVGDYSVTKRTIQVPAKDWIPCSEDWGGGITYLEILDAKKISYKSQTLSNFNTTGNSTRTESRYILVVFTLNPRTPEEIKANVDEKYPNIFTKGVIKEITEGRRENDPCCGNEEAINGVTAEYKYGREINWEESNFKSFLVKFININKPVPDLSFQFGFPIPAKQRDFYEVKSNCAVDEKEAYSLIKDIERTVSNNLPLGHYKDFIGYGGGEYLIGSKTYNNPDGSVSTWQWNLNRCKK